ncbi:hypothetical protein [Nocardioides sp.]|uniref:hypothetical protein n=1 Tax=Nocardioides sp. TaxID=35761 RepID=UPI0027363C87|nr:hypothetical protein [Nocardioides sp.]MDP3893903.1 hypothetical protein [Nocardioides sp.]
MNLEEDRIRRDENRLTVTEESLKTIISQLGELKTLTQAVNTWAAAQKEQNHTVAILQKEFNQHLKDRNLNCPLLDAHTDDHKIEMKVHEARKSVWLSQWKVISAAMSAGGGITAAIIIVINRVIGI